MGVDIVILYQSVNTRRQHHSCSETEGVGKRRKNYFSKKSGKMVKMLFKYHQFQGLWLIVQYNSLYKNVLVLKILSKYFHL